MFIIRAPEKKIAKEWQDYLEEEFGLMTFGQKAKKAIDYVSSRRKPNWIMGVHFSNLADEAGNIIYKLQAEARVISDEKNYRPEEIEAHNLVLRNLTEVVHRTRGYLSGYSVYYLGNFTYLHQRGY